MANIDHPDQIWTVAQFNEFCQAKKLPMKIQPAEDSGGKYAVYKSQPFQILENDKVQVPFAQGEANAVIMAVDRLKEKWMDEKHYTHMF